MILECAHIFTRSITHIRWDERNALCLCRTFEGEGGCHRWAHKYPLLFSKFVEEKIGEQEYQALKKSAYNHAEPPDFETAKKFFTSEIRKMEKAW